MGRGGGCRRRLFCAAVEDIQSVLRESTHLDQWLSDGQGVACKGVEQASEVSHLLHSRPPPPAAHYTMSSDVISPCTGLDVTMLCAIGSLHPTRFSHSLARPLCFTYPAPPISMDSVFRISSEQHRIHRRQRSFKRQIARADLWPPLQPPSRIFASDFSFFFLPLSSSHFSCCDDRLFLPAATLKMNHHPPAPPPLFFPPSSTWQPQQSFSPYASPPHLSSHLQTFAPLSPPFAFPNAFPVPATFYAPTTFSAGFRQPQSQTSGQQRGFAAVRGGEKQNGMGVDGVIGSGLGELR